MKIPTHPSVEGYNSVVELMEISIQPHRNEKFPSALILARIGMIFFVSVIAKGATISERERNFSARNTDSIALETVAKIVGAGISFSIYIHTPHEQALIQFYFTLESG